MKSIFKIAVVSLALAAVSTPVLAGPARIEFGFANGYSQQQVYVQPYEAPASFYRYQDDGGWRQRQWREHEWRERERREHQWRERHEWRERQWQERRWHEHEEHENYRGRAHYEDWR